jgi:hypothetical protein
MVIYHFMVIWYIDDHLVYFAVFWQIFPVLVVPRKIWQFCMTAGFGSSKDVHGFASRSGGCRQIAKLFLIYGRAVL